MRHPRAELEDLGVPDAERGKGRRLLGDEADGHGAVVGSLQLQEREGAGSQRRVVGVAVQQIDAHNGASVLEADGLWDSGKRESVRVDYSRGEWGLRNSRVCLRTLFSSKCIMQEKDGLNCCEQYNHHGLFVH